MERVKITMKEWYNKVRDTYGIDGEIAVLHFLCSMFACEIAEINKRSFPLLYVKGAQGCGKTEFIGRMKPLLGMQINANFNFHGATDYSLIKRMSEGKNNIYVFEEFHNGIPKRLAEIIKNTADRRGFLRNSENNETTEINNSLVLVGNDSIDRYPCSFRRTLFVTIKKKSKEWHNYEITGLNLFRSILSKIVDNNFEQYNKKSLSYLSSCSFRLIEGNFPLDNYSLILTMSHLISFTGIITLNEEDLISHLNENLKEYFS